MTRKPLILASLILVCALLLGVVGGAAPVNAQAKPELSIIWFAWPPCDKLQTLVNSYPAATVSVKCVPIGQWHDTIFTDFVAKGGADLPILDSQYTGEAVKGGHLLDLSQWMKTNVDVDQYVPAALAAYGEYPPNSKQYYGLPAMTDVMIQVYRKDIFEKEGFKPATTWTELLTQMQKIKADGAAPSGFSWFWCGAAACYDNVQTAWNQIAWSFGGELWDPTTFKVKGILDSAENVKALRYAAELYKTSPAGSGNFGFGEDVDAVCTGKAAETIIWVGFGPSFTDKQGCPQSDNLAYAVAPGEVKHVLSLGGMGIGVSSYTQNKDASLAFLKWFESKDTQLEWVKIGGYSARTDILDSDTFKNAATYNSVFADSYKLVKDFWNLPEYNDLLIVQGEQLNLAITGQEDAQIALTTIADKQQAILDKAYPNGPSGLSAVTGGEATKAP
ncbi:MAG: extracellular solute-binding protein [Chloroflexota bacterium]